MAATGGCGANSGELAFIFTGCAPCIATIKDIGVASEHIGICGVATTTTSRASGAGEPTVALGTISTASVCCDAGMGLAGLWFAATGTCGDAIITVTDTGGSGASTEELVCTFTGLEFCSGCSEAVGIVCERIGVCGRRTTITDPIATSGADSAALAGTATAFVSSNAGPATGGSPFEVTGTCTIATTTIIGCMAAINGVGGVSVALVCICIVCEHCMSIIRDTGAASELTGICGGGITTTRDPDGSGVVGTSALVGISIACVSIAAGMDRAGTRFDLTGTYGVAIITITCITDGRGGSGVASAEWACICTDCAPCIGIAKVIGVACDRTGTCTDAITTTSLAAGSGVGAVALVDTCIACESSVAGTVVAGTMSAATGISIDETTTIIGCMDGTGGFGVNTGASEFTCTGNVFCSAIIRGTGVSCGATGICGGETITTSRRAGCGAIASAVLGGIFIVFAYCADGMGLDGTMSGATGGCTDAIITTTAIMVESSGDGGATGGGACTCTACESSTRTSKVTGAGSMLIGTFIVETITTKSHAGSGLIITAKLAVTGTVIGCTSGGMVHVGSRCEATGISTVETIIITTSTAAINGSGDGTGVLACTYTACEHCIAITKAIGAVFVHTGTSGAGTIITGDLGGSGQTITVRLAGISIVCESCVVGMAVAGTRCEVTGTCTEKMHTIIGSMDEPIGSGVGTDESAYTSIACAHCTGTTRDIGAASAPIGIFTVAIITISDHVGSGADTAGSAVICTVCGSTDDGMELAGTTCAATGICTDGITTTITCMADTSGCGASIAALAFTCIVCEPCTATTRDIGVESGHTGTCGVATTTTDALAGSGVDTAELAVICTDCEFSVAGMVHAGTTCAATGTCGAAIITTTACMAALSGDGDGTGALVCTCTACAHCTAITKATGAECARTGICTDATITTSVRAGSGAGTEGLGGTCTVCAS